MAVIRPLFQPDPFPTVIYCFYTGQLYKWVLGGVDVKRVLQTNADIFMCTNVFLPRDPSCPSSL